MLNLDDLRDKLDNMLNKETADSLNQWLNNKRDMDDEQITKIQLNDVLDKIQGISYGLTLDEMNELIDEVTCIYERFSDITEARNGDKQK